MTNDPCIVKIARSNLVHFITTFLFLSAFVFPSSLFAQTATSTDLQSLILDLQAQIKALQTRISELEAELGVQAPASPPADEAGSQLPASSTQLPTFDRALSKGMSGDDVRNLQQFLAQFPDLYPEGLVTSYYGPLTEKAVQRWQEKEGIVASGSSETTGYGRIGPKTRAKLNELIIEGAGKSGVIPPGLLKVSGLQDKVATTTSVATTTPIITATTTPTTIVTTTPAIIATTTPTTITTTTPAVIATSTPLIITQPNAGQTTLIQPPLESVMKKWSFLVNVLGLPSSSNFITPAIGSDGTIYASGNQYVYAISPSGSEKWRFQVFSSFHPVIGSDGTIYISAGALYALDPSGIKKWTFSIGGYGFHGSPVIGGDGTVYIGGWDTNGKLYAVNPDGTQKWIFDKGDTHRFDALAVGADGTILGSSYPNLWATNPDGTKKWVLNLSETASNPAIGSDGTIYFTTYNNGKLYAVNSNGTVKWEHQITANRLQSGRIVIGAGNVIYIAPDGGDKKLFAYNKDGIPIYTQNYWQLYSGAASHPALGSDGVIYVGEVRYDGVGGHVHAFNSDGTKKWEFFIDKEADGEDASCSSIAIGLDGTIYFACSNGILYALNGTSSGLADSPWPKFQKNNGNTGGSVSTSSSLITATQTTPSPSPTPSPNPPPSTIDTTAPIISNLQVINITANLATISWTTNEPANSTIFYAPGADVMTNAARGEQTISANATSFSTSLFGLNSYTIYYYIISASDANGNTATSDKYLFSTLSSGLITQCNDALDNDGDGKIDMNDLDCLSPSDNNESVASASSSSSLALILQSIAAVLDDIQKQIQKLAQ